MDIKEIYKIINEEISGFDFLNSKNQEDEQESINIISDENFQRQFIIDSITRMRDKIKIEDTGDLYMTKPEFDVNDDFDSINISYNVSVVYEYNNKQIKFDLGFEGERLTIKYDSFSTPGDKLTPPDSDVWITHFPWDDINVTLYSAHGDEIPFKGLEKASGKTSELFIRSFLESMIENNLEGIEIKDNKPQYTSF